MTNEEKAHQIAWEYSKHYDPNVCKQEWVEIGAREMAKWKEKDMMANILAWLRDICRVCDITDNNGYPIDARALFASFEKSLKGGEE